MNTKSTDLSREDKWDMPNDRKFATEIVVGMVLSFLTGAVIATGLIFFFLSLVK